MSLERNTLPLPPHQRHPSSKPPRKGVRFEGCAKLIAGNTVQQPLLVLGTPSKRPKPGKRTVSQSRPLPPPMSCPSGRTEIAAFTDISVKKKKLKYVDSYAYMRCGFTPRSVAEESRSADEFFGDTERDWRGCRCLARLQHQQWHLLPKRTSVVADSEGPAREISLEQKRKGSLVSSPPFPHQLSCWGNNLQHLDVSCFPTVGLWRCVRLPALANRYRHNFWVSSVGPTTRT